MYSVSTAFSDTCESRVSLCTARTPGGGRRRGRGVYVWQSAGCARSRLWRRNCSVASARPARAESAERTTPAAQQSTHKMVHTRSRKNGCDGGADLSACEWVCSASCDHVYISRQASAAHRTHNNKNTTKHRSFQTATICSSWRRVRQRLRLSCTRAHSHGHTVPSRD